MRLALTCSTAWPSQCSAAASRLGAELLNASVDTCGGMAGDAHVLVRAIGEEGERWSAGTRSAASIERQLLSAIAVAIQRSNAMTMLSDYTRAASARMGGRERREMGDGMSERKE